MAIFNSCNSPGAIDKTQLNRLLDEIITPRVGKIGLIIRSGYSWYSKSSDAIRYGFDYRLLKGETGTFSWGVCCDFIPVPSGSSFKYFRTEKAFRLQLFEWTNEYAGSFSGSLMKGGTTTHWGLRETKKSISDLFDSYEERILSWFRMARSLEGLIAISSHQVNFGQSYKLHDPSPNYILAFLLARNGQRNEAIECFDQLDDSSFNNNPELRAKLRAML